MNLKKARVGWPLGVGEEPPASAEGLKAGASPVCLKWLFDG